MEIKFITGKWNSKMYIETMNEQINDISDNVVGITMILSTNKQIRVLEWLAKSPHLNIKY